jgi:hypothetical protein
VRNSGQPKESTTTKKNAPASVGVEADASEGDYFTVLYFSFCI